MFRFLKDRSKNAGPSTLLGHLEFSIMEDLWATGESNVRGVRDRLRRPLAYTTVMTTLERLFKKHCLNRRKSGRAFLYSPKFTRQEWECERAEQLLSAFLGGPQPRTDSLFSALVQAVGQRDPALLDALEKKIQARRLELSRKGRS
ncbi:MAG: BlaI/MecI/CopY family transcriptional regulator [Candidatus Acidiferrales bacterium]|jgi:predicted transcriptional regulator